MIYHSVEISLTPGKRFPAIEHMKKYASYVEDTYGVRSQVLGSETGMVYRHAVVSRYESLAQYDELTAKILADPKYQEWFNEGQEAGYFDWASAEMNLYRVY